MNQHLKISKTSNTFFSLTLVLVCSCQVPTERGNIEGNGSTFRDLRLHTASTSDKIAYGSPSLVVDGSRMAFVLTESDRYSLSRDIYVKQPNSKARVQKTTHAAIDAYPSISPDGKKIAFASRRNGSHDIFITNLDSGRAKRQITFSEEEEIAPSWSADSQSIAYCKLSRSSREWEIWLYDLNNGAVTYLAPGAFPRYSPTEDLIAFQRGGASSQYYGLWTIDETGATETQILSSTKEGYFTPAWSPDGKKLVFASAGKDVGQYHLWTRGSAEDVVKKITKLRAGDIWTINLDGTDLSQLTTHNEDDWGPSWAGDGRIYFTSMRDGYQNIWSVVPEFVQFVDEGIPTDH